MPKQKPLTIRKYMAAIWDITKISARISPLAVTSKIAGSVVNAILPLVTTYFAALTTTELASAFTGSEESGERALLYVVITSTLGLVTLVWGSLDQYIQQVLRFRIEAQISDSMYEKFHRLDFWRYDDKETIDLYDRAQRFTQFFAYVIDRITQLFSSVIAVVTSIVALSIFVPWIALLVIVAILPSVYIQFRLSRIQINHWNRNVASRRSRSFIEYNLLQPHAIAELRLNNVVRKLLGLRAKLRDKDEKEQLEFEKSYTPKRIAADSLQTVAELVALVWIVVEIINRQQPIGQFIYVQQIVSRAMSSSESFVRQLSTIDEDLANLGDYEKFMALDNHEREGDSLKSTPQKIVFDKVSFQYPGSEQMVLENVSLEINAGDHVAIVGENGAGKSTFIKLLCGLYHPTSGKILLDGIDITTIDPSSWHRYLSVLQQNFLQYNFTNARENVLFGDVSKPVDEALYRRSLDDGEASEFVDQLPDKDKTTLGKWIEDDEGKQGTDLSGGQWQRLAIARSFYRDAPFVIFDEPTSAIDALAESRIFKRIFDSSNKRTVITISHRLTTVEKADIIFVMQHGELKESGTHRELVAKKGDYYKIFEGQIERQADE